VLLLNGFDPADPMKNILAISLKSTGLTAAKELNRLITWRGKTDLFRGVYSGTSFMDKNAKGSYAAWKFQNAKWLTEGTPAFEAAREAWEGLKNIVDVNIDREHPDLSPDGGEGEDDPGDGYGGRDIGPDM
jgi:hypothetical protein